ncbi:type II toxin-antitoxin system PemK/MazF family toxin [Ruania alkalisoli]|uniref:Type II toxin-antitoxin system PemK/MazF family toxin n=1 Tax=Ruania alkalisoli TaxID=2779775 RepID=A0A7M1SR41_9MICO|nr:type II toxin-antitoxin system PemK/MazF family toxin [Ruania alkalisoli]QOR69252.1 type II toxin-antitoxin system PemK/MazF family toxin [Ruania alkalisoli]
MSVLSRFVRAAAGVAVDVLRTQSRKGRSSSSRRGRPVPPAPADVTPEQVARQDGVREYSGRLPELIYEPRADGEADPGEVVWAWVPYEDDPNQGKDRPVLILAEHDGGLIGLQLTSKDHDRDAEQEARWGRYWVDVGSGGWDSQRRPSEARLDRVLWLAEDAVRREGAALDRSRFTDVLAALRAYRRGA